MSDTRSSKSARASIEEVRQAELIEATLRTISERGFDATTVRDIARAAGASIGSVHYYFATKADLLRAAVADSDGRFRVRVRDELSALEGGVAKVRRLVELCFPEAPEEGPDWAVFIDFWQQASRRDDFRAIFEAANTDWLELLVDVLDEGVRLGEFVIPGSLRNEAMSLAALIDGLALHGRVTSHIDAAAARGLLERRIEELQGRRQA